MSLLRGFAKNRQQVKPKWHKWWEEHQQFKWCHRNQEKKLTVIAKRWGKMRKKNGFLLWLHEGHWWLWHKPWHELVESRAQKPERTMRRWNCVYSPIFQEVSLGKETWRWYGGERGPLGLGWMLFLFFTVKTSMLNICNTRGQYYLPSCTHRSTSTIISFFAFLPIVPFFNFLNMKIQFSYSESHSFQNAVLWVCINA